MRSAVNLFDPDLDAGRGDRPAEAVGVECFNAVYRTTPDYYGVTVPRNFRDFLAGRAVESLRCLDLGAGQGRYSLYLARAGATVRAVDISPVAMAQLAATARVEKLAIDTEVADLCNYDFPLAAYDLIVGATVLDHLDEPCRHKLAALMVSALKPGGTLYCEVFTTADPGWLNPAAPGISETAAPVRHYFAAGELRDLFTRMVLLDYREEIRQDRAHGTPHRHGLAQLVGLKA